MNDSIEGGHLRRELKRCPFFPSVRHPSSLLRLHSTWIAPFNFPSLFSSLPFSSLTQWHLPSRKKKRNENGVYVTVINAAIVRGTLGSSRVTATDSHRSVFLTKENNICEFYLTFRIRGQSEAYFKGILPSDDHQQVAVLSVSTLPMQYRPPRCHTHCF